MGYLMAPRVSPDEVADTAIFTRFRRSETFTDAACREDPCRPADVRRPPTTSCCADGCIPCKGCGWLKVSAGPRLVPIQRSVL